MHPVDGNDIDVDSSPSPGMAPGCGSGGRGPFERRFRMSLDEALRERREKMGEVVDDGSEPRSDEDSLIEHQQTGYVCRNVIDAEPENILFYREFVNHL